MRVDWPTRKLCDIADIRVSNVDKKTHSSEKPVKLCNYMDVYSNEYVTSRLDFMEASAGKAEIERFGLQYGDVVITKDSETPDDIGIPAVIAEAIDNLVCGYHLALIRPHANEMDSVFLAKQLSTSRVARYFALHASGSTRYGLPISAIESVSIPTPPKPEQSKVAEILMTVDRTIEQTEALIAKQQRIKAGLIQDLLTRGIDEHGSLRSEQTHDFKDSPLGRIPMEWDVLTLSECAERVVVGLASSTTHAYRDGGTPMIRNQNIRQGYFDDREMLFLDPIFAASFPNKATRQGDVLTVRTGANVGDTAMVPAKYVGCPTFTTLITSTKRSLLLPAYLVWYVESQSGQTELNRVLVGGGKENLNVGQFVKFRVSLPPLKEQEIALEYLQGISSELVAGQVVLAKQRKLRVALMQDLLTGIKRVTPLLEVAPIKRGS